MIKIENLSHKYENDTISLKDINLEIQKEKFIAIIGRNGCGKSTLAKHLNAIYLPQKGEIKVDDINVFDATKIWEIRKKVGMVFQNVDNQIFASIVEEDVAFGLENLNLPYEEIVKKCDFYINLMNISHYKKTPIEELSGGQKQKVLLAGILAMEPKYLILDEPSSMLDPKARDDLMENLLHIHKTCKTTIVLITHFMENIVNCDEVIVMDNANLVYKSTPSELFYNDEIMEKYHINPPFCVKIIRKLKDMGLHVEKKPITSEELLESLCTLE